MTGIMVGVDGSPSSKRALAWAANEAELLHSDLLLVQSWNEPVFGGPGISVEYEMGIAFDGAEGALEALAESVRRRHAAIAVETVLTVGHPVLALVHRAVDADLLVVGSRGNGGFLSLELGSVSTRVARRSEVPVVVVRGEEDRAGCREVVVGVDGSECSRRALRWADAWATKHDKALVILMAWNYLEPQGPSGPGRVRAEYRASDAEAVLASIVNDELGPWTSPRVVTRTVLDLPARAVLEHAADACLIVVGRHGISRWSPPDLGATAVQVLHHAPCPVAVIPEVGPVPTARP